MGFKTGIVGLPNVGKSTLFNALTKTSGAQIANFPFCTIDPNTGEVAVPDQRLEQLAKIASSKIIIPTLLHSCNGVLLIGHKNSSVNCVTIFTSKNSLFTPNKYVGCNVIGVSKSRIICPKNSISS